MVTCHNPVAMVTKGHPIEVHVFPLRGQARLGIAHFKQKTEDKEKYSRILKLMYNNLA